MSKDPFPVDTALIAAHDIKSASGAKTGQR
jgi:hypothetical protein